MLAMTSKKCHCELVVSLSRRSCFLLLTGECHRKVILLFRSSPGKHSAHSRRTTSHEGYPGPPQSLCLPLKRAPKTVSAPETSRHTARGKSSENGGRTSPESPNVLLRFPGPRRPGGYSGHVFTAPSHERTIFIRSYASQKPFRKTPLRVKRPRAHLTRGKPFASVVAEMKLGKPALDMLR